MSKGFTLIELIVVITIIAILSGILIYSVSIYINKSKDSNVSGNLAILIPSGEVWYNGNGNSYSGFCNPSTPNGNSVLKNAVSQMPLNSNSSGCYNSSTDTSNWGATGTTIGTGNPAGLCCFVNSDGNAWAAYTVEFADTSSVYCVDSRGMKESTPKTNISSIISTFKCP